MSGVVISCFMPFRTVKIRCIAVKMPEKPRHRSGISQGGRTPEEKQGKKRKRQVVLRRSFVL